LFLSVFLSLRKRKREEENDDDLNKRRKRKTKRKESFCLFTFFFFLASACNCLFLVQQKTRDICARRERDIFFKITTCSIEKIEKKLSRKKKEHTQKRKTFFETRQTKNVGCECSVFFVGIFLASSFFCALQMNVYLVGALKPSFVEK